MTSRRHVLVTGGAGYIGSMLVPMMLVRGWRVRVVDALLHGGEAMLGCWTHPDFEFVRGDLRDPAVVRRVLQGVDAVVHLAAIVGDPACARDRELTWSVNVDASLALLEACHEAGVERFVFASTCSNYGRTRTPDACVTETSELRPLSLYAESKVLVERALLENQVAGLRTCATVLRFATVYGVAPRMRFDLTVNEFTKAVLREGRLVVYGEQYWRPYIHVVDAARAIMRVLRADRDLVRGTVFNAGATRENYRKRQIVELVRALAPEAPVEFRPMDDDPRSYRVSFHRISHRLGFRITRTVPDGIAEVARLLAPGILADVDRPLYRNTPAA
jgi:nucleoside-diphosphate-sugar epimerase